MERPENLSSAAALVLPSEPEVTDERDKKETAENLPGH
jgi:hypothetical protein